MAGAQRGRRVRLTVRSSTDKVYSGDRVANREPEQLDPGVRTIALSTLDDKIRGGWAGQMIGVTFGAPTEVRYLEAIIPSDELPEWRPEMVRDALDQDDLYVVRIDCLNSGPETVSVFKNPDLQQVPILHLLPHQAFLWFVIHSIVYHCGEP